MWEATDRSSQAKQQIQFSQDRSRSAICLFGQGHGLPSSLEMVRLERHAGELSSAEQK